MNECKRWTPKENTMRQLLEQKIEHTQLNIESEYQELERLLKKRRDRLSKGLRENHVIARRVAKHGAEIESLLRELDMLKGLMDDCPKEEPCIACGVSLEPGLVSQGFNMCGPCQHAETDDVNPYRNADGRWIVSIYAKTDCTTCNSYGCSCS